MHKNHTKSQNDKNSSDQAEINKIDNFTKKSDINFPHSHKIQLLLLYLENNIIDDIDLDIFQLWGDFLKAYCNDMMQLRP